MSHPPGLLLLYYAPAYSLPSPSPLSACIAAMVRVSSWFSVAKRAFSFITDMAGLAVVPVVGLFLWHASRGVLNSLVPFQADYSRFADYSQITRLFADVPRVIIGLTVPMLMIFCAEIWLSTR